MNGNYMNQKHVFKFSAWYNTGVMQNYDAALYSQSSKIYPVHYNLSYKHRFAKFTDVFFQSRILDGMFLNKIGLEKTSEQNTYRLYAKSMRRVQLYYLPAFQNTNIAYGPFVPNLSSYDEWNNSLNIEWERGFSYLKGNAKLLVGLRSASLFSNFDYAGINVLLTQNHPIYKLELRSRVFASLLTGTNIAPESQVYLAGANPEEMLENKFARSAGLMPSDWFQYGQTGNHFQMGGGLNLRGYAGYLVPVMDGVSQQYLYRGNRGIAANFELDFDNYLPLRVGKLSRYFHIDAYLFMDAGIMGVNKLSNTDKTLGATNSNLNTGIMASAGQGFIFTIKRWGVLDEIKPLNIRFDMPLFLSNAPYTDQQNFKFRWVLGINRSF